jgi:hypothetical protein
MEVEENMPGPQILQPIATSACPNIGRIPSTQPQQTRTGPQDQGRARRQRRVALAAKKRSFLA